MSIGEEKQGITAPRARFVCSAALIVLLLCIAQTSSGAGTIEAGATRTDTIMIRSRSDCPAGPYTYTVSANRDFLKFVEPSLSLEPNQAKPVKYVLDAAGLEPGNYSAMIKVSCVSCRPRCVSQPQEQEFVLTVVPPKQLKPPDLPMPVEQAVPVEPVSPEEQPVDATFPLPDVLGSSLADAEGSAEAVPSPGALTALALIVALALLAVLIRLWRRRLRTAAAVRLIMRTQPDAGVQHITSTNPPLPRCSVMLRVRRGLAEHVVLGPPPTVVRAEPEGTNGVVSS